MRYQPYRHSQLSKPHLAGLVILHKPKGSLVAAVFFKDAHCFLGQRRRHKNSDLPQFFRVDRVYSVGHFRQVMTWDAVAFKQTLNDGSLTLSPGSRDNNWRRFIHEAPLALYRIKPSLFYRNWGPFSLKSLEFVSHSNRDTGIRIILLETSYTCYIPSEPTGVYLQARTNLGLIFVA